MFNLTIVYTIEDIIMNLTEAVKKFGKIKENLNAMHDALTAIEATGAAGGGLVKVCMNANFSLVSITIDPFLLEGKDVKMIEDLIIAAHHDAKEKVKEKTQQDFDMDFEDMPDFK